MDDTRILDCGHHPSPHGPHTTGTAWTNDNKEICWACSVETIKAYMREHGQATLYFVRNFKTGKYKVTDWTGLLSMDVRGHSTSRHNMARRRYDYWFIFEGEEWHGYTVGDNTQIAHCKRNKSK